MRPQRWFIAPLIVLGSLLSVSPASSNPTETDQLKKQVETLESQMRVLQGQVKAIEARLAPPAQGSAKSIAPAPSIASSDQLEAEAQAAITEIPRLADQGRADEARAKIVEFRSNYGSSKIAGQATYFSHELEVVGKDAPTDWGIEKWFQGEKAIDLSGKKPILIIFWEEWCPHCKDEMPKLEQVYAAHKAQGLQILGVTKVTQTSTDEKVQAYLAANGIEFPIAKESGVMSDYFSVSGVPAAVMIKSGKVVWRGHPIRITEETLKLLR